VALGQGVRPRDRNQRTQLQLPQTSVQPSLGLRHMRTSLASRALAAKSASRGSVTTLQGKSATPGWRTHGRGIMSAEYVLVRSRECPMVLVRGWSKCCPKWKLLLWSSLHGDAKGK
jgi:hypothetical protein